MTPPSFPHPCAAAANPQSQNSYKEKESRIREYNWIAHRGEGPKGVGPSTTLAWPGWKQPNIVVEVDTARLETSRLRKCCENYVLLYFLVLNSRVLLMYTDTVKEMSGYPVQNCLPGSFLS